MTETNFKLYSGAVSDRGLSEKRPQNEDSYLDVNHLGLFAVADGVGGAQAGDVASQMAMEILGEAFANLRANGDAEEMMKLAIERANSAIYQMSSDLPQLSSMATTIVALHISGNIATIGHVGDSRLYRLDSKGSLYRETQDHSVVEEEVRAGRMTPAQALTHPSRNVISRAVGAENNVEVDMKTIMFDSNTVFFLCSDGVTRHLNDFEIRELMILPEPPDEICLRIKEIVYSRGAEDNLTAVIIKAIQEVESQTAESSTLGDEEQTVASPRPPYGSQFGAPEQAFEEIPTQDLEIPPAMMAASDGVSPTSDEEDHYLMADDEAMSPPDLKEISVAETATVAEVLAASETAESQPVRTADQNESFQSFGYEAAEPSRGGSSILTGIMWLIAGLVIGAAGYWLATSMTAKPQEPTPISQMQTNNIPQSSFEDLRRKVDSAPETVIAQFEKTPPQDASEFYFLGRAFLLMKRHDEAKKAFLDARNRLADYNEPANKAVLITDLTSGLISAQDKTNFDRELGFAKGVPQAQGNTNK